MLKRITYFLSLSFRYLIAAPLELGLLLCFFGGALISVPGLYFSAIELRLPIFTFMLGLFGFSYFILLLFAVLCYLKFQFLSKDEYSKVLGNRNTLCGQLSCITDIRKGINYALKLPRKGVDIIERLSTLSNVFLVVAILAIFLGLLQLLVKWLVSI
ncbi:hypothetical protein AB4259_22560 [Vibrio amylolyticus]|uniref:hypothetical protein n=1 Tax=Vibrio amylolyticus TaxID=2847292 RepID=UPI003553EAA3